MTGPKNKQHRPHQTKSNHAQERQSTRRNHHSFRQKSISSSKDSDYVSSFEDSSVIKPIPAVDKDQEIPTETGYVTFKDKMRGRLRSQSSISSENIEAIESKHDTCCQSKVEKSIKDIERMMDEIELNMSNKFASSINLNNQKMSSPISSPFRKTWRYKSSTSTEIEEIIDHPPFDPTPGGLINPRRVAVNELTYISEKFKETHHTSICSFEQSENFKCSTPIDQGPQISPQSKPRSRSKTPERFKGMFGSRVRASSDPTPSCINKQKPSAENWSTTSKSDLNLNWRSQSAEPQLKCTECKATILQNCSKLRYNYLSNSNHEEPNQKIEHIMLPLSELNPRKVTQVLVPISQYMTWEGPRAPVTELEMDVFVCHTQDPDSDPWLERKRKQQILERDITKHTPKCHIQNKKTYKMTDYKLACSNQSCGNQLGRIYKENWSKKEFVFFRHSYNRGRWHIPGIYLDVDGKEETFNYFKFLSNSSKNY